MKHHDGEPLTRVDLQYDLLYFLFNDSRAVFTDPYVSLHGEHAGSKVTFRDLYVNALVHSPRCSKVSRDKLLETPAFADEFAKISLLSNVGRINTTMACESSPPVTTAVAPAALRVPNPCGAYFAWPRTSAGV